MCLLICKPAGLTLDRKEISLAIQSNPHGVGMSYPDNGKVVIKKGLWNIERTDEELSAVEHLPLMLHFRFATHGSVGTENAHPFELANGWAVAHNGIINIKCENDESDTRSFIRQVINPWVLEDENAMTAPEAVEKIESMIGWSKIGFMDKAGGFHIINEKDGHWINGVWFSNNHHLIERETVCSAGSWYKSHPSRGISKMEHDMMDESWLPEIEDEDELRFLEFNSRKLTCDMCGQKIKGRFVVDRDYGMLFCHECNDK